MGQNDRMQACQRPVGHGLGKIRALQEDTQIERQCAMDPAAHLIEGYLGWP